MDSGVRDIDRATDRTRSNPTPQLGNWWWLPSAFAILALLLLLVVPAAVDRRVAKLRGDVLLGSEHARVLLNDLEAAFASQLLVRADSIRADGVPNFATRGHLDFDEIGLHAAVRDISPEAVARYNQLSDRLAAWNAAAHDGSSTSAREGLQILSSAEELDNYLVRVSDAQRAEVRRLERYYVMGPAVLAPVALIAILIVMWSGRRTLRFARLADEERAQVVRASEARAALLRGVTHDVKNPLGAAAGYAQLMAEGLAGPMSQPQVDMVNRIHRLVQMAVQTVTDLLELARADGELQIEYAAVDLANLVTTVVDDHEGMAREHGVSVSLTAPSTPIVTDPLRVQQVLANLLSNAIKYTPSGGRVFVRILESGGDQPAGHRVGVEVRDTGPGIPRELQSHVFEEFFRVRSANTANTNGNGLGLAISRRIARLLGADVTFADADGGGAVFTLWFRATTAPAKR